MTQDTRGTRVKKIVALTLMAAMACVAQAQSGSTASMVLSPVEQVASHPTWEYGILGQGGTGVTEDRNGFKFAMAGIHVGRVLTHPLLNGKLRGTFEYSVELFPFWQSYTPVFQRESCTEPASTLICSAPYNVGGTYTGVSLTPFQLRWNLTSGKKVMPWVQGAGGLIWTNHKYPAFPAAGSPINLTNDGPNADASVWNFTPQGGVGVHYFIRPKRSIDIGANAIHISSASLGDRNPGVNATIMFTLGYTLWK